MVERKIYQRRRRRRKLAVSTLLWRSFIVFEVAVGGASGVLLGAIIVNAVSPGHWVYIGLQGWLRDILCM